ncbi:MAG: type II toxin-antitoxin system PemK/MazF family toxin, partial [Ekhidna sp.]|nr:type II toxin-antitoxin system PemK/MazF family toxin [Ekhidna sp.]
MGMVRFDIYWANLDPTIGSEMKKTRPVVIVSPDVMNRNLNTVLVCPLNTTSKSYPTRISVNFEGKEGMIALDHIRSIDKKRLVNKSGRLSEDEQDRVV